ncbi:MAG TPA: hypothetical protein VJQ25_00895, partial [Nitrospira sp.]|nr:hypothetical protein [Nitrospira sp.]
FVCRFGNGANVTYRLGFGNDIMSASDPVGIWWEFDSTTMNAMAKLRVSSYHVDQAVFPWVTDQTYVISVRTEPDRSGDEYYGSLFTWTQWGFHETYPGGLYPVQQLVHLEGEHSGMSGGPEFGVRTTNNNQKVLDVDYAGGFVYDGNFQPIW